MTSDKDTPRSGDALDHGLRALGRLDARDEAFGEGLRAALLQQVHDQTSTSVTQKRSATMATATIQTMAKGGSRYGRYGWRARLVSVAAAVVLALGGSATYYLRVQAPTPVSAQSVLRQAAAALATASPDEVAHVTSTFYYGDNSSFGTGHQTLGSGPITFTVDQLTQYTKTGAISQQVASGTSITGTLLFRMVQTGGMARLYGPGANVLEEFAMPRNSHFSWADNPFGIASPQQFVLAAQQNRLPNVHLLSQQQLDGIAVYVVESSYADLVPSGAKTATAPRPRRHIFRLYVDAQDYTIRGMDSLDIDAGAASRTVESLRVTGRETLALSSIPADTFALDAPASARVIPPSYDLLSVAEAVARPGEPAPLLSGDAEGLRLRQLMLSHTPPDAGLVYYSYGNGQSFPGTTNGKSFAVMVSPSSPVSVGARQGAATESTLSLTIAGETVQATYYDETALTTDAQRRLTYRQGAMTVQLIGTGLSKDEFFAAVRALVDGHAHPDVVTALQRELDTP